MKFNMLYIIRIFILNDNYFLPYYKKGKYKVSLLACIFSHNYFQRLTHFLPMSTFVTVLLKF